MNKIYGEFFKFTVWILILGSVVIALIFMLKHDRFVILYQC